MVKRYSKQTLETIARNTLKQCGEAYLNGKPQAVPLERLVEESFDLGIEYMHLTESGHELGRMICTNGYTTRFNSDIDNYELVVVSSGTILIEANLLECVNLHGRFRFTLAHELAHWILHRELFAETNSAAAHSTDTANDDIIEWQANYLAQAMLMPTGQVKRGFYALVQTTSRVEIIHKLATIFEVSKQAMGIRLQELGLI